MNDSYDNTYKPDSHTYQTFSQILLFHILHPYLDPLTEHFLLTH